MFLGPRATLIREELACLSENGLETAFDDFGTGFASLTHLRDLPIRRLKIDRSFVVNLVACSRDETIVRSIVDLAHSLGMVITAEGVETEEQFQLLNRLECDRLQGFLFGKPLPQLRRRPPCATSPPRGSRQRSDRQALGDVDTWIKLGRALFKVMLWSIALSDQDRLPLRDAR